MAGEQQVTAADARTQLTTYGHAEDTLKGMQDADVLKLHGAVSTHVGGLTSKALEAAQKDWQTKAPVFGDKWRETLAGEDPEDLKTLTRFKDPKDLWGRTKELNKKFSSGEIKVTTAFPEKGTDQEKAAWRKEQGIPETHDKYDLELGDGIVIGEGDKQIVDMFLKSAHGANFQPAAVKHALKWFFHDFKTAAEQERSEGMANLKKSTEDKLRETWKGDFRMKRTAIENLVAGNAGGADSDLSKLVLASVDTNPAFAEMLANIALELNPAASLMPAVDGAAAQMVNIETKIKEIEGLMKTDRKAYNAREGEYRQLLEARDRIKGRATQAA